MPSFCSESVTWLIGTAHTHAILSAHAWLAESDPESLGACAHAVPGFILTTAMCGGVMERCLIQGTSHVHSSQSVQQSLGEAEGFEFQVIMLFCDKSYIKPYQAVLIMDICVCIVGCVQHVSGQVYSTALTRLSSAAIGICDTSGVLKVTAHFQGWIAPQPS